MKRFVVFAIMAVCYGMSAFAQGAVGRLSVIPKVGVNVSNLPGENIYYDTNMKMQRCAKGGFTGGLALEYQITKQVAVGIEALYADQGCKFKDFEYDISKTSTKGVSSAKIKLQYVNVPLMASYYILDGFAVKAGVQMGFLLNSKLSYNEQDISIANDGEREYGNVTKKTTDYQDVYKKTDIAIPFALSYEYMNVIIEARYSYGLTKLAEQGGRNSVLSFTVGYRL